MEDVQANWNITGHIVDDKWVVEHFRLTPEVGDLKFWFSDLFHGNMEMSKCLAAARFNYYSNEFT